VQGQGLKYERTRQSHPAEKPQWTAEQIHDQPPARRGPARSGDAGNVLSGLIDRVGQGRQQSEDNYHGRARATNSAARPRPAPHGCATLCTAIGPFPSGSCQPDPAVTAQATAPGRDAKGIFAGSPTPTGSYPPGVAAARTSPGWDESCSRGRAGHFPTRNRRRSQPVYGHIATTLGTTPVTMPSWMSALVGSLRTRKSSLLACTSVGKARCSRQPCGTTRTLGAQPRASFTSSG
jgi:hypothetical protein